MKNKSDCYSKKFGKKLIDIQSVRLDKVLHIFKSNNFNYLLDIGCGDGSFQSLLKDFSDKVYGVDIAEDAIRSSSDEEIIAFKLAIDSERFPFRDNYFDAIYLADCVKIRTNCSR